LGDPVLSLQGLRKTFGALVVTDDVTLDLVPGELHALIGPNGAGKTTLVNQIAGNLSPDAGRILLAGTDITALGVPTRARLGLARTWQITSILPGFPVLDNVALAVQARDGSSFRFFGAAVDEPALNANAREILDSVGLQDRAAVLAGSLSHGEKRALELAMALALRPKLLLLDEPMAGTGADETERLIGVLRNLKGRLTMLLVEHDMRAVFALADRVSVLVYGRIIVSGLPDQVRADPEVRRAYLGEEG
jgi:branched-chain amino acid transport system ATP-binding protein